MFRSPVLHRLMRVSLLSGLVLALAPSRMARARRAEGELRVADRSRPDAAPVEFHAQGRDVRPARSRSTAFRAGRRSCSSSWEPTARSATSTFPG